MSYTHLLYHCNIINKIYRSLRPRFFLYCVLFALPCWLLRLSERFDAQETGRDYIGSMAKKNLANEEIMTAERKISSCFEC